MFVVTGFNVVMLLLTLNSTSSDQEKKYLQQCMGKEPDKYQTSSWVVLAWFGGLAAMLWFL
jgi:hypothetical protein